MTTPATENRTALDRLLQPSTIAIVGLSDASGFLDGLRPTFDSDAEIFVVNPRYDRVMGRPTAKSLTDLDRPVDCVMSVMAAERSTQLAEEAADLDIGGLVLMAGGFAESGPEGVRLQQRLRAAAQAGGFAAVGPNGLGFENVPRQIRLTIAVKEEHNLGGLSIVSQSGAMLSGITMAGNASGAGFNLLISAGNEAVTDMADFVDYLVDDPATKAIGLVIEKIRRPDAFFAAVRRAIAAGKPIVAAKLARSERTQRMAASHTGALTGDAWVYDIALRQLGVSIAYDPEEVADRLALIDKIPPERWTPVQSLGVVTMTGGFASLTYDIASQEGVPIPALDDFLAWVQERVPGALVPNPLDTTGLGGQYWREILDRYITSDELDAFYVTHPITVEDEHVRSLVVDLGQIAAKVAKPVVLANSSGLPAAWTNQFASEALAFGRGVRPSMRGLETIGHFVRYRDRNWASVEAPPPLDRPAVPTITEPEGEMLPFDATMRLLREAGIPVAPYALIDAGPDAGAIDIGFPGPYVAKLANVAHRTEHNAVRLNVAADGIQRSVEELRAIACDHGLSPVVAIQPMLPFTGEVLIGIHGTSELGPMVVFGLGGIFVEALARVGGRLAPFDEQEARDLIDEFRDVKIMHGFRGRPAWDLDELARILVNAGRLAAAAQDWIGSLDLNPVLYGENGYFAVDALLLVKA